MGDEMWGWWGTVVVEGGHGRRDGGKEGGREEEEAAAVLELMSACQIRNTMHLRQRITEKGGDGETERRR